MDTTLTLNCTLCVAELKELQDPTAPLDYARMVATIDINGWLKLICVRHNSVIVETNDLVGLAALAFTQGCAACNEGHEHSH